MSDSIRALANSMVLRKNASTSPYILFLGAGASISSGCSNMLQIVDDVLKLYAKSEFDEWENKIVEAIKINKEYAELLSNKINIDKRAIFFQIWEKRDPDTKYSILKSHLLENKEPSEGYEALAQLMKNGFISTVFSTNLDNLLEKALIKAGLYLSQDFIVLTIGRDLAGAITHQLSFPNPPIKIIKLHGSLEFSNSYAFSPKEVFDFESNIKYEISRFLNQSLIIVGYSGQDRDIDMLFERKGKEIHFVKPTPPNPDSRIYQILVTRGRGNVIDGTDGNFDIFFKKLLEYTISGAIVK